MNIADRLKQNKSSFLLLFFYCGIIVMPIILTIFYLHFFVKVEFHDFRPIWSDEVVYWQEINTFKEVNFSGGYFSADEQISKSSFSRFGTHGPSFAVIYGSMAKIFGWELNSGFYFNLGLLSFSLLAFLLLTRPNIKQSILMFIITSLLFPIFLYLPSTMQETLVQSLAILLGGFLIHLAQNKPDKPIILVSAIITLVIACLVKILFILALLPILFFMGRKRTFRWFCVSFILTIVLSVVFIWIFQTWTSPFPDRLFYQVTIVNVPLGEVIKQIMSRADQNMKVFIGIPETGFRTDLIFRYQFLGLLLFLLVFWWKQKEMLLPILFLSFASLVLTISLYDIFGFRDMRTLAPFFIMAILTLIFCTEHRVVRFFLYAFIISGILAFGTFVSTYKSFHAHHFGDVVKSDYTEALTKIDFRKDADPWCNSMLTLVPNGEFPGNLSAGIGINFFSNPGRILSNVQSHYLFFNWDYLKLIKMDTVCEPIYREDLLVLCERTDDDCP